MIKQANSESKKAVKREKGQHKDDTLKKVERALEACINDGNVDISVKQYRGLNIPDKYSNDVTALLILKAIQHDNGKS